MFLCSLNCVCSLEPLDDRRRNDSQPRFPGADVGRHRPAVPPARLSRMARVWSSPKWWPAANSRKGRRRHAARASAAPALPSTWCSWPGREAAAMAEAARIAEGEGADIIDINMGCPAKKVTGGYSGSALMRDLDHAVSLIDAVIGAVARAGDGQDAARLGRATPQRAGAGAPRRTVGRAHGHRPWPHALPVLPGQGGLAGHRPRQGRRCRFRWSPMATSARPPMPRHA